MAGLLLVMFVDWFTIAAIAIGGFVLGMFVAWNLLMKDRK